MRLRLKGVALTHKKLASGKRVTYHYAWRGGPRLPGLPGSPEFMAAYHEATKARMPRPAGPTIATLIARFQSSPDFTGKAALTRREYARYLKMIEGSFGATPLKSLAEPTARGRFKDWRDGMADRRRTADYAWSVLARLMSFGVDRGMVARNPCEKGGRLYVADRAEKVWSDATLATLFASASPEITAAVMFALWTGQRQSDCLTARWDDLQDGKIAVRQAKGGSPVLVPLGAPLASIVATLPRTEAGTILTNSYGEAWTGNGFRASFRKAVARASIIDDLHFHDLRGTAVTRMALAGCSTPEIAAVTGHSPRDVDSILAVHYLGGRAELAEQAIRRLASDRSAMHHLQTAMQTGADLESQAPQPSCKPPVNAEAFVGAGWRIRTPDLLITNQLLYRLS